MGTKGTKNTKNTIKGIGLRGLRDLGGRRGLRRGIEEEINVHLDMATRERVERGMSPAAARAAALREFGNVALIQQTTREVWTWTAVEHLLQDLRFGGRILWHAPGLSITAIVLIALVIGGNTTIYSIVNALLVSPAPGVTTERLVAIKHVAPGMTISDPFVSYPNYLDYARLATSIDRLAGWSDERLTIRINSGNYAVLGGLVTTNYFDTFGVAFVLGRPFRPEDDEPRDGVAAVISDRLWREKFAQAPDVIGKTLHVNGVPTTVVGVTAPEFGGVILTAREDVWVPIAAFRHANGTSDRLHNRADLALVMVGQRSARASLQVVRAEFQALAAQLHASFPDSFMTLGPRGVVRLANPTIDVRPYSVAGLLPIGDLAPRFLALFSIVTLLTLLVVSANIANLLLGRAVERQRDVAVRRSLGASRARILRMLLVEGAAIAVVGWSAACVAAWWTARLLFRLLEPSVGALSSVRPDWTLAAYAMTLAAVTTMAFTVAPAARAWQLQILPLLRSGEQSVAPGRSRLSNTLVVLQLAFSVLLLTSAGLAYRSLSILDSGDVGFDPDPLLLATVRTAQEVRGKPDPASRSDKLASIERVREHLLLANHVRAVTYGRRMPGAYFLGTTPVKTREGDRAAQMFLRSVGPDYLKALGLEPAAGRDLSALDRRGRAAVAVINAQLAKELFPGVSPLGRTLLIGEPETAVDVVGVAPDAMFDGPVHDPHPRYVFVPLQQLDDGSPLLDLTFFTRYEGTLDAVTPLVSRAIAEADATLPIVAMSTMRARLNSVTVLERQIATLLMGFALTSLVIAALGQYAAAMFNMRRRTRDFGVRMALGASTTQIQRAVVREAFQLTVPGVAVGLALSAVTATAARAALFGVTPLDPVTYLGVLLTLALTSLVASYLPAWRAGRVNVVDALRTE